MSASSVGWIRNLMRGRESDLVASCSLAAIMDLALGLHFMHAYALPGTACPTPTLVLTPELAKAYGVCNGPRLLLAMSKSTSA